MREQTDVVVIGGGLAGLTAAAYLAPSCKVTVVETANSIGGQCAGEWLGNRAWDFGVHGMYPRYTELKKLLTMAGASTKHLIKAKGQHIVTPDGRTSRVRMPFLPAPLHCVVHSCLLNALRPQDRLKLLKGATRLICLRPDDPGLDEMSVREMSQKLGIPLEAFRIVFEPLAWIGFFLRPEHLSASAYLSALRFLIIGRSDSWRAQWIPSPNGETLVRPLVEFIQKHNGQVYTGIHATGFSFDGGHIAGVRITGPEGTLSTINGHWVVCAVPPLAAAVLIGTLPGAYTQATSLRRLGTTEVRTFRFWFESGPHPLLRHGVALTEDAGFVFLVLNELMPAYRHLGARVIEVQCSPDVLDAGVNALEERVRMLLPDARDGARLLKIEATDGLQYARYSCGSAAFRPSIHSPWPNLFFAGDWVHDEQGTWFMERAVSTGHRAANAVLGIEPASLPARSLEGIGVRAVRRVLRNLTGGPL